MSKLRIESKAQIMRDKSIQRDEGAYKKAKDEFAGTFILRKFKR